MAFFLFSLMLKPGQTGTAVWGRGELFPLGVFYAAACKGIGETDLCLVGRTKGESALASYRCAEAVFPVAGMVRRIPYTKGGLSMVRSLARRLPAEEEKEANIGIWAMQHKRYLKQHHKVLYYNLHIPQTIFILYSLIICLIRK